MSGPRIALVAGEASGDILGAGLVRALRERFPEARFEGVAGPLMRDAGCQALAGADELAVMGLSEVIAHLPRLLRLRRRLIAHWLARPPDVFVGIDAPDFNLGLEGVLKHRGIRTLHYVSPSVWAWRQGRVHKIARSVDRMLTLFPFEADFYRRHDVPVTFVGHPLADLIEPEPDRDGARERLGLNPGGPLVALLPGSRVGEVGHMAEPFLATAAWLRRRLPGVEFVAPMANRAVAGVFNTARRQDYDDLPLTCVDGRSRDVMAASDAVLLASGTATLEALLLKRPMVVAYRVAPLSAWILRRTGLIRIQRYSIPNLLMERAGHNDGFVGEFMQERVDPVYLGPALYQLLRWPERRRTQIERFHEIHRSLRMDADRTAAAAVADVLENESWN